MRKEKEAAKPTYRELENRILELETELNDIRKCSFPAHDPVSLIQIIIDTFPCPGFYKDRFGRYQAGNRKWCEKIVGLPLEKITGKTVFDFPHHIPGELAETYHVKDMYLMEEGGVQVYESKAKCTDGSLRDFMFHKAVFYDDTGPPKGILGLMIDITELNKAKLDLQKKENELLESNERLEDILFSMPHGILIVNPRNHQIMDVNPKAASMIGSPADRIVGNECHRFVCPRERGRCPITDLKKPIECAETVLLTKDGTEIPILKTVIQSVIGEQDCLVESFVDITHHKEAEMIRVEKDRLKGALELAGAICHELNQPLMSISGYSELLSLNARADEKTVQQAINIRSQVERMGTITRKLMGIARYHTKDYLDKKIFDLDRSVDPAL